MRLEEQQTFGHKFRHNWNNERRERDLNYCKPPALPKTDGKKPPWTQHVPRLRTEDRHSPTNYSQSQTSPRRPRNSSPYCRGSTPFCSAPPRAYKTSSPAPAAPPRFDADRVSRRHSPPRHPTAAALPRLFSHTPPAYLRTSDDSARRKGREFLKCPESRSVYSRGSVVRGWASVGPGGGDNWNINFKYPIIQGETLKFINFTWETPQTIQKTSVKYFPKKNLDRKNLFLKKRLQQSNFTKLKKWLWCDIGLCVEWISLFIEINYGRRYLEMSQRFS